MPARPTYPSDFKRDAVELARSSDRPVAQVARELGINAQSLRNWIKQDEIDRGEAEGLTSQERKELRELRRENRKLKMERDILKKAAAWFAKESERL